MVYSRDDDEIKPFLQARFTGQVYRPGLYRLPLPGICCRGKSSDTFLRRVNDHKVVKVDP